jgi:hypothetical protein
MEPLSVNEARQFLRHAARVPSRIELATNRDFRLLSALPEETCMFPRLQSVFADSLSCPTRCLHLFLSPTLCRCALWTIDPDLKLIVTRCASLKHLPVMRTDGTIADKIHTI